MLRCLVLIKHARPTKTYNSHHASGSSVQDFLDTRYIETCGCARSTLGAGFEVELRGRRRTEGKGVVSVGISCARYQALSQTSFFTDKYKENLAAKTRTGKMSGKTLTSWNCHRLMLQPTLAAALLLVISPMYLTVAQHHRRDTWRENYVEPDFVSQMGSAIREAIESLIGQEAFRTLNENLSSLIWIVSCGISSALFVVARIAGQFLTSFGMAGDHATQFLKLKPEDVQVLLLWGLAALIGYWVLSLLLHLVLTILSRIMWGLKVIIFGTCFIYIATVVPDRTMQTWLLLALLMIYVLLGWLSGSYSSGAQLEAKVRTLELQLEELQYRQRRSPKHKADE